MRLGSTLITLDFIHIGSTLSLRTYARLGSALTKPRNPRHFDRIEGGRTMVGDGV